MGQIALVQITYMCLCILQRCVEMEGKNFLKLCKDTKLMGKALTSTDIDLIFTKVGCSLSSSASSAGCCLAGALQRSSTWHMHPWLET